MRHEDESRERGEILMVLLESWGNLMMMGYWVQPQIKLPNPHEVQLTKWHEELVVEKLELVRLAILDEQMLSCDNNNIKKR